MIELIDIASEDFTIAKSDEKAAEVLHRLTAQGSIQLIIEHLGEPTTYWLLDADVACEKLRKAGASDEAVLAVLELKPVDCVPALDATSDADLAPSCCVVLRNGRVIGFCDAVLEFGLTPITRGDGGEQPVEAEPEEADEQPDEAEPEEADEQQLKSVELALSAPLQVRPGEEFTATFAAYVEAMADRAEKVMKSVSSRAEPRMGVGKCQWSTGTEVTVQLAGSHLHVDVPVQSFRWGGEMDILYFDVRVDDDAPESTIVLKFDVKIEGFCVARLRADLEIQAVPSKQGQAKATVAPAKTAFASYSSKDRLRVLDCVAALQRGAGMDIFLDCLSLKPSEQWKSVLDDEIASRDLFLLFWSRNTVASPWVQWEISKALAKETDALLQVYPLDTPEEAPPPPELSHLHFGDQIMYVRKGMQP